MCGEWEYDSEHPMPKQRKDWDCSAAATAWMGRSLGWGWEELDVAWEFQKAGIATPAVGLLDATGVGIVRWLSLQPMPADNFSVDWPTLLSYRGTCPLIMGSSKLYHWLGVRLVDDHDVAQLANSAPGWGGVWQTMTEPVFESLAPWYGVAVLT